MLPMFRKLACSGITWSGIVTSMSDTQRVAPELGKACCVTVYQNRGSPEECIRLWHFLQGAVTGPRKLSCSAQYWAEVALYVASESRCSVCRDRQITVCEVVDMLVDFFNNQGIGIFLFTGYLQFCNR